MRIDDIERQNARLRCTLAERGEMAVFISGHSAALGIALCALVGEEFTQARLLIMDAILKEIDSLESKCVPPSAMPVA